MSRPIAYRPEIDGMRAVAVLSVIIFHAEIPQLGRAFKGGLLGVDIFFVISGYLITLIILKGLSTDTFSFKDFYDRRVRRILPAFFTVAIATTVAGIFTMTNLEIKSFSKSLISSIFFSSNFHFLLEDRYFSPANAYKPFLHTWSLAIEEQFYLFFPLLMFFVWKKAKLRLPFILFAIFFLSLVICQVSSYYFRDVSFYLLPGRAWELMAGALIAQFEFQNGRIKHNFLNKFAPLAGILLILFSLIILDPSNYGHPGFITLVPITGAVLLIGFTGYGDIVTRILSSKIFVGIGLISYSLYLWHQPVFAITRIMMGSSPPTSILVTCILISLFFAWMSWKWVERPFRSMVHKKTKAYKFIITTAVLLVTTSIFIPKFNQNKIDNAVVAAGFKLPNLLEGNPKLIQDSKGKYIDRDRSWVLIGDSHADTLRFEIANFLVTLGNTTFISQTQSGCPTAPGFDHTGFDHKEKFDCFNMTDPKFNALLKLAPSTIVVYQNLPKYLENISFVDKQGRKDYRDPYVFKSVGKAGYPSDLREGIRTYLKKLLSMGHRLVIIYPTPEFSMTYHEALTSPSSQLEIGLDEYYQRTKSSFELYDSLGQDPNIIRIYPVEALCDSYRKICSQLDGRLILYKDANHLSETDGVRKLFSLIKREVMKN